jgi:diguanylate cyclase (GGDEF)-like protein/putative nucleotidyltransferase with HDIG domain
MSKLPRVARFYIFICYLLGLVAVGWLAVVDRLMVAPSDWVLALGLAGLAGLAQTLTIERSKGYYADHLTPAPVAAALLVLPTPLVALVVIAAFLPEWVWRRRPWFIQLFNIATWLVAVATARAVLDHLNGVTHLVATSIPPTSIAAALAVFLVLQTVFLVVVLWLARGESPRRSNLLVPTKLGSEIVLLCIGWLIALAWTVNPILAIVACLPLVLIFQALHVPNLRDEAATDPKTGLANMRHFRLICQEELARATQASQPVSLLMCDLDHFRAVNNTYGHQAGDDVIVRLADLIRQNIRACDTAARFGGEEFAILLTDTDRVHAWQVAERLRDSIERHHFPLGEGVPPIRATVSIGVAGSPMDGSTVEGLIREADLALYQAKRDGRNRVVTASRTSRELIGEWTRTHPLTEATPPNVRPIRPPRPPAPNGVADAPGTPASAAGPSTRRPAPLAAQPERRKEKPPAPPPPLSSVNALVATIMLGALLILLALFVQDSHGLAPNWVGLLLFALLIVPAEQMAVEVDRRGKTSVTAAVLLGATFLEHGLGILIAALTFAVWAKLRAKSPFCRMAFNFGTSVLSAVGAHAVMTLLIPAPIGTVPFAWLVLPAAAAGLVYYIINHALLCLVRGLAEACSPWQLWQEHYRWLWPYYLIFGVLGVLLSAGFQVFGPVGLVALTLPIAAMQLSVRQYLHRARRHVAELQGMNEQLGASYNATLDALSRALDTRDEETEQHSRRVQRYTCLLARRYGVPDEEIQHISRGALLHDIGKIGVPDAILLKPGGLSDEERAVMQRHASIGYAMIAHIPFLTRAAELVLHHHESYDGTGYPSGLAGDRIPLSARIFAVADTYDAITSDRPYRRGRPWDVALAEIARNSGGQFDPRIVDVLLAIPREEMEACAVDTDQRAHSSLLPTGALVERTAS